MTPNPESCYRDSSGDYVHSNGECPDNFSSDLESGFCPFQEWDVCYDQLRLIETVPFFPSYFRNPAAARSQNMLKGFGSHCFTHHYRYVLATQKIKTKLTLTLSEILISHTRISGKIDI
jgi:hypothetical protein